MTIRCTRYPGTQPFQSFTGMTNSPNQRKHGPHSSPFGTPEQHKLGLTYNPTQGEPAAAALPSFAPGHIAT